VQKERKVQIKERFLKAHLRERTKTISKVRPRLGKMSGAVTSRVPTVKMILTLERAIVDTENCCM
jgi:hypothetical protein